MSELDNQMLDADNQQAQDVDPDEYAYLDTKDYTDSGSSGAPAVADVPEEAEEITVEADDEGSEGDEEVIEAAKPQKPHNKKPGYYARVNQEQRRRDQEIELLRQQNLQLQQQMMQQHQPVTPQQPVDEETRQAQQITEFVKSIAAEVVKGELTPLKQQEQERHMQEQKRQFDTELNKAAKRYSDYHDVVKYNDDIMKDANILGAAQLLPNYADVLYHLGRNDDLLHEIKYLPPLQQAQRLAKISNEIAVRQAQRKFTQAGAPLTKGSSGINKPSGSNKTFNAMKENDFRAEAKDW